MNEKYLMGLEHVKRWEKVKRMFVRTNWTQKKLAIESGVSEFKISNLLSKKQFTEETISKVERKLNL